MALDDVAVGCGGTNALAPERRRASAAADVLGMAGRMECCGILFLHSTVASFVLCGRRIWSTSCCDGRTEV